MKPIAFLLKPLTKKYLVDKDISYGSNNRQKLDIYSPKNAKTLPVIIFFYGGSWIAEKRQNYGPVGASLAKLGYVVVVPDYRLFPEVKFPGFVEDGANAIAWVEQNIIGFGGEPKNINLIGHSAGGMIGALLSVDKTYSSFAGFDPAKVKRFVGLAGSYNSPLTSKLFMKIFPDRPEKPAFRAVNVVTDTSTEIMLIHGALDKTVNPNESRQLAQAYKKAGGRAQLQIVPKIAHAGVMLTLIWPINKLRPTISNLIKNFIV